MALKDTKNDMSTSGFKPGRIGNPMLTKEDYDQIDAEEMELMDIKWCLASVLRRDEKFKQITGRDDLRDANVSTLGFDKSKVTCFRCREKGHFKRECTNREASGAQNPFNNNNDYYRKAIYHQVGQSSQQQKHQAQTAHGRDVIEDTGKRACVVNPNQKQSFTWDNYIPENGKACLIDQEDEKLAEGFSWANFTWDDYIPDQTTAYTAFTAKIVDDSDDDTEYWARKYREDMKLVAESDSEDEKVKKEKKKKKIKTPVSSDDEEVPVVRRQKMTEVPKFKVEEQVDAKEVSVKCENCEIVKKQNSTLIYNLNSLKESYDVLNKTMNQYNQTSEEQAVAMKTLQGAFMTKQKVVNNYIEKCAALEQKLELQRIETERVNRLLKSYSCTSYVIDRIYPTVESMKVWEEDEIIEEKTAEISVEEKITDKKKSDKKKDTEKTSSGTSTDEEEKTNFWRETNSEFLKKKQAELKKVAEQKKDSRTCFKCNNVGHIAKDCSQAIQSKQGVFRKISEKVFAFESPLDRTKLFKDSIFEIGESSNKFYKKRAKSDNQKWVVKKVGESSSDDSDGSKSEELSLGDETDSTKSVEPQVVLKCEADEKDENSVPIVNDEEFPSLRADNYKKRIGKVEISNQFFHDEQEFDAEKVFNSKVKNIFGKMIDRKVNGVKEFYEKKTKKEKVESSLVCDWDGITQYFAFVEERQKIHPLNTLFSKVNELKAALGPLMGRSLLYCIDACLRRYLEA
uniref:Putative zinc finger, CCHC-type n=1 Tax=Helianthus annuus TaxID=4232 RepID=A0A251TR39_HELAN